MILNDGFRSLLSHLPLPILIQVVTYYKKTRKNISQINQFSVDKNGIPFVNYGKIFGKNIGKQRNPVVISQYALKYFENFEKDDNNKHKFHLLNCVNWFLENGVKNNDAVFLEYNFPWPKYNLEKPWRSGMAQGLAIQALVKVHKISKEDKFLILQNYCLIHSILR